MKAHAAAEPGACASSSGPRIGYLQGVRALVWSLAVLSSITLAAGPATAQPDADVAKLPPRVEEAARTAFVEAQTADQAGDLDTAIERYRYVQKLAPHPNVLFNLADVLRRKGDVRNAAREYRAYLKALPDAPDAAKVEKVLASLEATPGTIEVDSRGTDAVMFVDGERLGPPPITVTLAPGPHRFEAITPLSYRSMVHDVAFAQQTSFSVTPPARMDGNLVISGSGNLGRARVDIDGKERAARVGDLIEIAAGKHKLEVVQDGCRWDKTVAPPNLDILYVYFDVTPPKPPKASKLAPPKPGAPPAKPACGKATITVQRFKF